VEGIEDKVTQDVEGEEGTGVWSTMVSRVALRLCSTTTRSRKAQYALLTPPRRWRIDMSLSQHLQPHITSVSYQPTSDCVSESLTTLTFLFLGKLKPKTGTEKDEFEKSLERATYGCILGAFVEGLDVSRIDVTYLSLAHY
jgi:hypothetical protein